MFVVPVAAVVKVAVCPTQAIKSEGWVVMVMMGLAVTVKVVALTAVFPLNVTEMSPVVASTGTVVVMEVAVLAVTTAVVPLNKTVLLAAVVLKFVPVMVTVVPTGPEAGVKLAMVGSTTVPMVKSVALVTVEQFVATEILPVVVPAGTVTVRLVVVLAVTVAILLLKKRTTFSAVTGLKFIPVMVTLVPMGPTAGVKEVTVGSPEKLGLFLITDIDELPPFANATSCLPSPSKSPIETDRGFMPVMRSTFGA